MVGVHFFGHTNASLCFDWLFFKPTPHNRHREPAKPKKTQHHLQQQQEQPQFVQAHQNKRRF